MFKYIKIQRYKKVYILISFSQVNDNILCTSFLPCFFHLTFYPVKFTMWCIDILYSFFWLYNILFCIFFHSLFRFFLLLDSYFSLFCYADSTNEYPCTCISLYFDNIAIRQIFRSGIARSKVNAHVILLDIAKCFHRGGNVLYSY